MLIEIDMADEHGRRLIRLIEKDLNRRAGEDYRFTIKEEAAILGVSEAVLGKWLKQGQIARIDLKSLRTVLKALGPAAYDALGLDIPQIEFGEGE